ncbi:glycoside hydrolase family 25 protein [Alteraurantiacibacter aquimixticola]|uniref:Lysozyme n=1 Tax=Alteraurantiacibacter aquimixticola TaxID=2489173 RepID=A0A4T3F1Q7_9SPHN|nr:glycoside hydrolase family 25 protein [Alteraurantiacibacter aquimixticola]TIX51018.1 lysozyme [Alteraurantiacibacter aquimixticola]
MGRKRAFPWRWRIVAAVLLLLAVAIAWLWWEAQHWVPSREEFPTQGVLVGARDGEVDFRTLAAIGANFAYIEASAGESGRDARLSANLRALEEAPLPYGAVHAYDPCIPAERQAANFVTIVPRDAAMLPPVIALDALAEDCATPVSEAAVESELTTFLNQVESHTGQRAILLLSSRFEDRYAIASRIERNLWLEQGWLEPDYAGRPWTLWTANPQLWTEVTDQPLRWVVAQP